MEDDNIIAPENFTEAKATWGHTPVGELYKSWPKIDGQPEQAVFLSHCTSNDLEDEMLINMLGAYGIPAVKHYPNNGSFGKIFLGISGNGADIFVPASLLDDAKQLIGGQPNE